MKVLRDMGYPAGASKISERLEAEGIDLKPRSIRFHLAQTDQKGFTRTVSRRRGREITPLGKTELLRSNIVEKIGFVASKVDTLGYKMSLDTHHTRGTVIVNIATLEAADLERALAEMAPVFASDLGMGDRVIIAREGERIGDFRVPAGNVAIATVCSITINGVFLHEGIPVVSRYGGLLEIKDYQPRRFIQLVEYSGTTMDPLETYILANMTKTRECARSGAGVIGVSFREIPSAAIEEAERIRKWTLRKGLGGILKIGKANRPLLDIPVSEGRAGMLVQGGVNPIAAVYEAGIRLAMQPLADLVDIDEFHRLKTEST